MSPEMDMYGLQAPDFFHIDDLLDFSNDDLFSSTTTTDSAETPNHHHLNHHHHHHLPAGNPGNYPPSSATTTSINNNNNNPNLRTSNFTDDLCVPNDDVAELEWLSKFVDDSFSDFAMKDLTLGTTNYRQQEPSASSVVPGKARSKRTRVASSTHKRWISLPESAGKSPKQTTTTTTTKKENIITSSSSPVSSLVVGDHYHHQQQHQQSPSSSSSSSCSIGGRKCTHCASEKTPQWRTGPMGPKTLCNACGVRYKSGRLVPEYRPAASPTFVLTQHSNSHRKVMELRRQKEAGPSPTSTNTNDQSQSSSFFHHRRPAQHDFEVC